MQAPRTDVCNLGATAGFYMISNSKSGRPKNSSCASLFSCCHALVLKYHLVQPAGFETAESMPDLSKDYQMARDGKTQICSVAGSKNQKSFWELDVSPEHVSACYICCPADNIQIWEISSHEEKDVDGALLTEV